jgi:hypothetical protein
LAGAVSVDLDEGPGLVATQRLMFVFTEYHRLIRAGLTAHGG